MKALILAAGKGTRLKPLTNFLPKALIPLQGRPIISYIIAKIKQTGLKDIGIVINKRDYRKFKAHLKIPGVRIKYIFQNRAQGTARAVSSARKFIGKQRFLLCWCDFISPFDFRKIIRAHQRFQPSATILINREKDPSGTAQIKFQGPKIVKIAEKPKKRFSFWGQTGLLVLEPEIFPVLVSLKPSHKGEYHVPDAVQKLIDAGKKVRYLKIDTWKVNLNRLDDLWQAVSLMLRSLGQRG